jgi:hypothetical protein
MLLEHIKDLLDLFAMTRPNCVDDLCLSTAVSCLGLGIGIKTLFSGCRFFFQFVFCIV